MEKGLAHLAIIFSEKSNGRQKRQKNSIPRKWIRSW
jgi:hypothetical protein